MNYNSQKLTSTKKWDIIKRWVNPVLLL